MDSDHAGFLKPCEPSDVLSLGVIDLPDHLQAELSRLLTVEELPTRAEIPNRFEAVAGLIFQTDAGNAPAAVMIGAAPWMMGQLVKSLKEAGVARPF